MSIELFFLVLSLILTLLFFVYGFNQYFLLMAARDYKISAPQEFPGDRPTVSIHLPVYNERYVIRRLVTACAAMVEAYGKERASILILDDSDDDTIPEVDRVIREFKEKNFQVDVLRRDSRDGFKAGALQAGLLATKEEFITIFDADFIPSTDFLDRTLPHFGRNEKLGIVQGRWTHLNQDTSLVTRAISHIIDVHFLIDQPGRYSAGLFQNFNGSGGVIRKKAIQEAGGWQSDTLAEDLDLSYRMQMIGYRVLYLKDILCPGEIPPTVPNFKQQQGRWANGSMKTARKILPGLLQNRKFGFKLRLQALIHLTGYMIQPLMVISFMLSCLASFLGLDIIKPVQINALIPVSGSIFATSAVTITLLQNLTWFLLAPLITLCTLAPWISLVTTLKAQKLSITRNLGSLLVLLLLSFGISLSTMRGVGKALFVNRTGDWIRTPKHADHQNKRAWQQSKYQVPLDLLWIWELVFVIAGLWAIGISFQRTNYTVLFILVPFTLSYGFVLYFSLLQSRKVKG